MPERPQTFGFFVEGLGERAGNGLCGPSGRQRPPDWLELPASGLSYLTAAPGAKPAVHSEPAGLSDIVGVCEAIEFHGQPCLFLMARGRRMRVDGMPATRVEVLHVGSQVQLDGEHVLHLSMRMAPYLGPPRAEDIGRTCPLCRTPIGPETTAIWMCSYCGSVYHCEGDEKPAEDRLECGKLISECVHCNKPVVMKEGYSYVPEC